MMSALFEPLKLGNISLENRVVMAPLTRCRATEENVPTELMATYYAQRAGAGLIIAEATMAMSGNSAFYREPGIHSDEQVVAWRKVTDAVHQNGGKIVLQLWHGGRACHPVLNNGRTPVAPSALAIDGYVHTPQGKKDYVLPQALSLQEIANIVEGFAKAAINAKAAGFDGVEIHGANGYLIDEFLRDSANTRTDQYGGSMENRSRLLFEVIDAVTNVWESGNVGLRISPINSFNSMRDSDPEGLTAYLAKRLDDYNLAYLHVMRADFQQAQQGNVIAAASKVYDGNLIGNMGYDFTEAEQAVEQGDLAAVAFGSAFIANPDLPYRFKHGIALAEPDPKTFYTHDSVGYIDYPAAAL
ncbi:alkene reductase [Aliiglaciecola sp. NS0011-25]|uniref:alkene reductase n=1 Tax=Aliiglaciecola sp. NS0011-25 TaxID=3127654 RepID=UPI00333EDF1A